MNQEKETNKTWTPRKRRGISFLLYSLFFCFAFILCVYTWESVSIKEDEDSIERIGQEILFNGPPQKEYPTCGIRSIISKNIIKRHRLYQELFCFTSQHGEDLVMFQKFFGHITEGFFVEIGGLDGVRLSATLFFERFMNWSGILIEASPVNVARHRRLYASLRNRTEYIAAAVCPSSSSLLNKPNIDSAFAEGIPGNGLQQVKYMTFVTFRSCRPCSRFLELDTPDMQRALLRKCSWANSSSSSLLSSSSSKNRMTAEFFDLHAGRKRCLLTPVTCIRMDELLRSRCVTKVDLFILDVEGAELLVLQTLDLLHGPPIHFFIIELKGESETKDREVRRILRRVGFVPLGRIGLNEVWQNTNFDTALRSYVKKMRRDGNCFSTTEKGGKVGNVLYGPIANHVMHQRWSSCCFKKNVTPEIFFARQPQLWIPPFHTVEEVS